MCLKVKGDVVFKVATKPIVVYKEIAFRKSGNYSLFEYFKYKRLRSNEEVKLLPKTNENSVYSEIHAGYHSDIVANDSTNAIFVIPKGATYAEGQFNSIESRRNYVSSNIVYIGPKGEFWTKVLLHLYLAIKM